MSTPPSTIATILGTALISLVTGYFLGLGSSIGILPSPLSSSSKGLLPGRIRSDLDSEESSSSDIDDDVLLDNAPNWSNGEVADRRQGLRVARKRGKEGKEGRGKMHAVEEEGSEGSGELVSVESEEKSAKKVEERPTWENSREECKLVLVVRTDLGMTKGSSPMPTTPSITNTHLGKIAAQAGHATLACYKTLLDQKSPILRTWERLGQAKIAVQIRSEEEMYELQAKAMSLGLTAEIIADAGRTQIEAGSHTVLGIGPAPKSVVDAVTGHLKLL